MELFVKKLNEVIETDATSELKGLTEDGNFSKLDTELQQKVVNSEVIRTDVLCLRPTSPIIKHGTLLGSKEDLVDKDSMWHFGASLKKAIAISPFGDDFEPARVEVSTPKTQNIENMFRVKKTLDKTLMVVGDYIEIIKNTRVALADSANTNINKKNCQYTITHYVEILDATEMYRIATSMFAPEEDIDSFNVISLITNKFDEQQIRLRYEQADIDDIIQPLQILS